MPIGLINALATIQKYINFILFQYFNLYYNTYFNNILI